MREEGSGVAVRVDPPNSNDPLCVWNLTGNWERSIPLERRFPVDVVRASSKEVEEPDWRPLLISPPSQTLPPENRQILMFLNPPGKLPGSEIPVKTVDVPTYFPDTEGEELIPRARMAAWNDEEVVLFRVTPKRSSEEVRLFTVKSPVAERLVESPVEEVGSIQSMA